MVAFVRSTALGLLLAVSLSAEARDFYKATNNFRLSYTSAETGTLPVAEVAIEVRYSDDKQFCFLLIGSMKANCRITQYPSSLPFDIYLLKDTWGAVFAHLNATGVMSGSYLAKMQRILSACKADACNFYILETRERETQIDDDQPEAFHLKLGIPSKPVKL